VLHTLEPHPIDLRCTGPLLHNLLNNEQLIVMMTISHDQDLSFPRSILLISSSKWCTWVCPRYFAETLLAPGILELPVG
jgi:hypothetical protein